MAWPGRGCPNKGWGRALVTRDILRNGDVISGALLAALGVYVFLESRTWPYYSEDGPGPGFFPAWYGIAMIVLSLALVVSAISKAQTPEAIDWPATRRALATWAAFALAAALMGWLGFLVSFALLTFFVVVYVFQRPPLTAVLVAVATSAGFYAVFPLALNVPLPTGVFGF
jgi:putative tricarboxylic transport membrane protein